MSLTFSVSLGTYLAIADVFLLDCKFCSILVAYSFVMNSLFAVFLLSYTLKNLIHLGELIRICFHFAVLLILSLNP